MRLAELLLNPDRFWDEEAIKQFITHSKNFDASKEVPADADALLMFETSKQKTWLVSTHERMYCILDDTRKDKPHINWSMARNRLVDGNNVTINVNAREKSKKTGLVDISDQHKDWLYTKQLFSDESVVDAITGLISKQMIGGE